MANSNPKTENLKLGRGKRPKLNNVTVGMRMSPETKARLEEIAEHFNCLYGGKPWIAGLLEKIGSNELIVSEAPSYLVNKSSKTEQRHPDKNNQSEITSSDINSVFEDEIVERYGSVSGVPSELRIDSKGSKDDSEHNSVPTNSD